MNKPTYLLLLLSTLFSLNKKSCKDARQFDTEAYYNKTVELKENLISIDSMTTIVGNVDCFEPEQLDSILLRYNDFCFSLENFDQPNKELLTIDDCVVKKEIVDLKSFPRSKWFKKEFERMDSLLNQLSQEVKSLKKFLEKDCVKKYNLCEQSKKHDGNKKIIKEVENLVNYLQQSEEDLYADSLTIIGTIKTSKELLHDEGTSQFYEELLIALGEDLQYKLSHEASKLFCNNAHIRWSWIEKALLIGTNKCEVNYLEEISTDKWNITVDSTWLLAQAERTRICAIIPRGCRCEKAENFNPIATQDNGTCIGCLDSMAINYCSAARIQNNFPCIYAVCNDRCYDEKPFAVTDLYPLYQANRDSIIHTPSLCGENRCGCMNPCASNYDPAATKSNEPDDCTGSICGCLDSTAVNYARRVSPDWAYRKYYNENIINHEPSLCIYSGCKDPCSLNFDPIAKTPDNSCSCDSVSRQDLEKIKINLGLKGASYLYSADVLRTEFDDFLSKGAKKYSQINFRKIGLDLYIDVELKEMKIKSTGEYDGIPLGQYNFKPVNETIDALINFLNFKTTNLLSSMLIVKIVGEADAHPIRGEGIDFKNAGRPVDDKLFKIIPNEVPTDIDTISKDGYNFAFDSQPVFINEGDKITDNLMLAFLRAYIVEQKIKDAEPLIEESRMMIGAKANNAKGKKYRRVAISMQLEGFYETMAEQEMDNMTSVSEIDSAIIFYEKFGYVTSGKVYPHCPCVSTSLVVQ